MNKKSESVLLMVFEVLAVLIVTYIMINYARTMAESDTINKIITAEKLSMLSNAELALSGNAVVNLLYLSDYIVDFKDNLILVYRNESDSDIRRIRRHFIPDEDTSLDEKFEYPEFLFFIKQGSVFSISSEPPKKITLQPVPEINTKDMEWKSKLIVFSPLTVDGEVDGFVRALVIYMQGKELNIEQHDYPEQEPILRLLIRYTDESGIKITYSQITQQEKNRKLALILGNKLSTIGNVSISIGEGYEFEYADISLVININNNLKKETSKIFNAIYSALGEYYEK